MAASLFDFWIFPAILFLVEVEHHGSNTTGITVFHLKWSCNEQVYHPDPPHMTADNIQRFESNMVGLTGQKNGCFVSRWTDSELFFERKQLTPALQQVMVTYSR